LGIFAQANGVHGHRDDAVHVGLGNRAALGRLGLLIAHEHEAGEEFHFLGQIGVGGGRFGFDLGVLSRPGPLCLALLHLLFLLLWAPVRRRRPPRLPRWPPPPPRPPLPRPPSPFPFPFWRERGSGRSRACTRSSCGRISPLAWAHRPRSFAST